MTETEISREIQAFLEGEPHVKAVRVNAGGYRARMKGAPAGTADILCCAYGRALALEVKTPAARAKPPAGPRAEATREAQKRFAEEWREAGGYYYLVTSVEDVEEILRDDPL